MRIVHLGKYYHPHTGGIETHVRTLAQSQAEQGHEVQVVCISHDRHLAEDSWDGPVFVKRFLPEFSFAKFDWLPAVTRYLNELDCDILHIHVPNPSMSIAALQMRNRFPMVIGFHSDIVGMRIRRWLFQPLNARLFRQARAIGVTHLSMVAATPELQQYADRIRAIPYGLDLDELMVAPLATTPEVDKHAARDDLPVWLMCGRLVPYKGHQIGIAALAHVPGRLVIVGTGPLRRSLEKQAARLGVSHRVAFLGKISTSELYQQYRQATALWFPSTQRSEAFGLVQVEAMACGCPVINTSIPGSAVSWVSLHEETGLTVPVGDPQALAMAADRIWRNPEFREQLSNRAVQRSQAEFDRRVMTRRWNTLYESVCEASMDQSVLITEVCH